MLLGTDHTAPFLAGAACDSITHAAANAQQPAAVLSLFCMFVALAPLETWLSSYGVFALGIDQGRMSGLVAVAAIAYLLSAVPIGWLGTCIGRHKTI